MTTSEQFLRAKAVRSWAVQWVDLEPCVWLLSGRTCLAQYVHGPQPFFQPLTRHSTRYRALMLVDTCLTTMETYMRMAARTTSPNRTLTGSRVLAWEST